MQKGGGTYKSYSTDAQGSVVGLEQDDGAIASNERYEYDPYGALQKKKGETGDEPEDSLSEDAKENPFRFQGFYYDSGVKTYDMRARSYRPELGRFLTSDRFESASGDFNLVADPLTQNRYAFAGGNPVTNVEWDGHDPHGRDTHARGSFSGRVSLRREKRAARALDQNHRTMSQTWGRSYRTWVARRPNNPARAPQSNPVFGSGPFTQPGGDEGGTAGAIVDFVAPDPKSVFQRIPVVSQANESLSFWQGARGAYEDDGPVGLGKHAGPAIVDIRTRGAGRFAKRVGGPLASAIKRLFGAGANRSLGDDAIESAIKARGDQGFGRTVPAAEIDDIGMKWVRGPGGSPRPIRDRTTGVHKGWISSDGSRLYRFPQTKRSGQYAGHYQANLEDLTPGRKSNLHVEVVP